MDILKVATLTQAQAREELAKAQAFLSICEDPQAQRRVEDYISDLNQHLEG